MHVLAGTSKGVIRIAETRAAGTEHVLESRGVRDVTMADGRAFAATEAGLYASRDRGDSWTCVGLADRQVWQVRSAGDGQLYAATQPAGLFRSSDGGASWVEITSFAAAPEATDWCVPLDPPLPGRARALVIDRDDPRRLWVGVEVGGVMSTTDGGETWKLVMPGDNPDLHMMWAHPAEPRTLFASTGYGRFDGIAEMVEPNAGVFRSDDYGQTWSYVWRGITPRYARPMCIDDREPYSLTVASAPTAFSAHDDDGGAGAMLFRSDDRGESWRSLCDAAHSPSAANFHGLTIDPDHPSGVLVGTDTGEVWQVSDRGEWTLLADGLPAVLALSATA